MISQKVKDIASVNACLDICLQTVVAQIFSKESKPDMMGWILIIPIQNQLPLTLVVYLLVLYKLKSICNINFSISNCQEYTYIT